MLDQLNNFDPYRPEGECAVIGKGVPRADGIGKVTGETLFVSDFRMDNMLYGKCLRSPYPRCRIKTIDTSKAEALPGVKAVMTYRNAPPGVWLNIFYPGRDCEVMSRELRHVGDEVAAVAAESLEIADEGLGLIEVEYELLPHTSTIEESLAPGAPKLFPEGNVGAFRPPLWRQEQGPTVKHARGDVLAAFAAADVIIETTTKTQKQNHNCMETHSCIAYWHSDGRVTMIPASQGTGRILSGVAQILGVPMNRIQVTAPHIGGGFGSKNVESQRVIWLPLFLSRMTGRPVMMQLTRQEQSSCEHARRHGFSQTTKIGAKKDGTITAMAVDQKWDCGGYVLCGNLMSRMGVDHCFGTYQCPNVAASATTVYTSTPGAGPFRGFAYMETTIGIEMAMDEMAEALGMDPVEFRKKNCAQEGGPTVKFGVEKPLSTGKFRETIDAGARAIRWPDKYHEPGAKTLPDGRKHGIGVAICIPGGGGVIAPAACYAKVNSDGTVNVSAGFCEIGAGQMTAHSQIFAEELGVRYEDVHMVNGDSAVCPYDWGQYGGRTTLCTGNAVWKCAHDAKMQIFELATLLLKDVPVEDMEAKGGWIYCKSDSRKKVLIKDVLSLPFGASMATDAVAEPHVNAAASWPQSLGELPRTSPRPPMVQFAEVAVDTETGLVEILNFATAMDCGRVINPQALEGQFQSSLSIDTGLVLSEDLIRDPATGKILNLTFENNGIRTALDAGWCMPSTFIETREPDGPFGARGGAGEAANSPGAAAMINAIANAIGVRLKETPITPDKVLAALKKI